MTTWMDIKFFITSFALKYSKKIVSDFKHHGEIGNLYIFLLLVTYIFHGYLQEYLFLKLFLIRK